MMWIDHVHPLDVLHAYVAAVVALIVFGIPAAMQQQRHSPIRKGTHQHTPVDWPRALIVFAILAVAIAVNVTVNIRFPEHSDALPFLGLAVWAVLSRRRRFAGPTGSSCRRRKKGASSCSHSSRAHR